MTTKEYNEQLATYRAELMSNIPALGIGEALDIYQSAITQLNERACVEAKAEEVQRWLGMVRWPNNYIAMRKAMEDRIAALKATHKDNKKEG